ncbi:MAG: inositol monophosphatase family protein [Bacteroidales bacterium]|jgi:myo-inositol-1(or 4)-monophosphatase
MNIEKICNETREIIKDVGKFLKKEISNIKAENVELKGYNDFVTYVDKTSEQRLVDALSKLISGSGFIVEEKTTNIKGKEYTWIIDPLDGTTNYIHSVPLFAISVALTKNNKTILGVVYEINLDECFYAFEGGGAFLNDNKINVSKVAKLKDSLLATGFPNVNYSHLEKYMKHLEYLFRNTHGVRRLGSAATDLAYVACGRYDGFYEYNLSPWDVAAGAYIVEQAGGKVSDFKGGKNYVYGKEIIATNNFIFEELLDTTTKYFIK